MQLLLGAGHRLVAARALPALAAALLALAAGLAFGKAAIGATLRVLEPVVSVERLLLLLGELSLRLDAGRVLHRVLRERELDVLACRVRPGQRHEVRLRSEAPRVHKRPLGLAGLLVEIDLVDLPDLLSIGVHRGAAAPLIGLCHPCFAPGHLAFLLFLWVT